MAGLFETETAYGELTEVQTDGLHELAEEESSVERFLLPQRDDYAEALAEVTAGRKLGHWIWYIFPQMRGLGFSTLSHYYGLTGVDDAAAFLRHPVLGTHYRAMVEALMGHAGKRTAEQIFGSLDALKVRSSLTLFERAGEARCAEALKAFYGGARDAKTLAILGECRRP